jgi:hypothetical protein
MLARLAYIIALLVAEEQLRKIVLSFKKIFSGLQPPNISEVLKPAYEHDPESHLFHGIND